MSRVKFSSKTGEIELEVLDMPKELKEKIKAEFLNGNSRGGRPNLLRIFQQNNLDPYKMLLRIVYLMNVEGYSYDRVVKFLAKKPFNLEIAKSTIFNMISKLKKIGVYDEVVEYAISKVKRKIRYYYITENGEIKSDIDYVQEWIDDKKTKKSRRYLIRCLKDQADLVNYTRKLPHQWNNSDVTKYLNEKFEQYLNALKQKASNGHLKYSKLTDSDLENIARRNMFNVVVGIRQILIWIGKTDLLERSLKTDAWKRMYSFIERLKEYLDPQEVIAILTSDQFSIEEKLIFKLHLTLGCREGYDTKGGLLNLTWDTLYLDAETSPYGYPACAIYESKTKGGTWWRGICLTIFFDELPEELKAYRPKKYQGVKVAESLGFNANRLKILYKRIQKFLGRRFTPHFIRHSHATLLIRVGIPMEMIAGKPNFAYFGVGWEDLSTLYKFYVALGLWNIERYKSEILSLKASLKSK